MAVQFNTSGYNQLNNSINDFFSSGKYSAALMTVYTDPELTVMLTDKVGPIQMRQIEGVNLTQPHLNVNGQQVYGNITIKFTDGTSVVATDNVNQYWYVLEGLVFKHKTYGTPV